jgi:hypothetical protein
MEPYPLRPVPFFRRFWVYFFYPVQSKIMRQKIAQRAGLVAAKFANA